MVLNAEAAQHTISAHITLRIAISVPAWTAVFSSQADRPRSFTSIHVRALRGLSVRGIDGANARTAIAARVEIAAKVVIGIRDAVEKSSRSACLALLVARKGAVAETRIIVALNAKGIAGANGLGGHAARHRQAARRQQSQNCVTHENLLI